MAITKHLLIMATMVLQFGSVIAALRLGLETLTPLICQILSRTSNTAIDILEYVSWFGILVLRQSCLFLIATIRVLLIVVMVAMAVWYINISIGRIWEQRKEEQQHRMSDDDDDNNDQIIEDEGLTWVGPVTLVSLGCLAAVEFVVGSMTADREQDHSGDREQNHSGDDGEIERIIQEIVNEGIVEEILDTEYVTNGKRYIVRRTRNRKSNSTKA